MIRKFVLSVRFKFTFLTLALLLFVIMKRQSTLKSFFTKKKCSNSGEKLVPLDNAAGPSTFNVCLEAVEDNTIAKGNKDQTSKEGKFYRYSVVNSIVI